ncbi:hypothetical protein GCM10010520_54960 [Rhizobium viscosum]|uniref:Heme-degrading monooxygenase HmoA n=1 Tax=Rhizobium viscosum TaxID=1673 RepID=A0ABR9J038_RHIVS|nr:heme-degrading monooxygenase HmoA [Rhizobium viscosum]
MIYEIAQLPVYKEHTETFKQAFAEVAPLLSRRVTAATFWRRESKHPNYST